MRTEDFLCSEIQQLTSVWLLSSLLSMSAKPLRKGAGAVPDCQGGNPALYHKGACG